LFNPPLTIDRNFDGAVPGGDGPAASISCVRAKPNKERQRIKDDGLSQSNKVQPSEVPSKKTGHKVKTKTNSGTHKAAKKTRQGAEKVEDKTAPPPPPQ